MKETEANLLSQAAMYAAGALESEEFDRFESRLLAGDPECRRAFDAVRDIADQVLRAEPEEDPRLIARSNLINAISPPKPLAEFAAVEPREDPMSNDPSAMVVLRRDDVDWQETTIPGVQSRNLFIDHALNRVTVLLKLEPGVVFPDHDHPGVEECLVLEGDLDLAGKTLRQGDYIRIPKGGQHGAPRTRSGCVLLVISPLADVAA